MQTQKKKSLLEEAIADAKEVINAATANAKISLEESLTPAIKKMISKKLQEEFSEEDEEFEESTNEVVAEAEDDAEETEASEEEDEMPSDEEGEGETETPSEEESEDEEVDVENMSMDELKDLIKSVAQEIMDQGQSTEDVPAVEEPAGDDVPPMGMDMTSDEGGEEDEEINLEALLAEFEDLSGDGATEEAPMEENATQEIITILSGVGGVAALASAITYLEKKAPEKVKELMAKIGNSTQLSRKSSIELEAQLQEAKKAIQVLKDALNEGNLLNAKLLYVNKLFREKTLNDSQKANVVVAFDKAETVKEVKLVYETVSKSIGKAPVVKEHFGQASKQTGDPKIIKESVVEVDPQVRRLQRLAGIIKD